MLAPLEGDLTERLEHEAMCQPPRGQLSDDDRPGVCGRLQARGDVRRVAQSHLPAVGSTDDADGGLAAVDPDAYVELVDTPCGRDVVSVFGSDLDDSQSGAGSAIGIVLVRGRHAEEGCDSVAHVRLHGAPELLDRV